MQLLPNLIQRLSTLRVLVFATGLVALIAAHLLLVGVIYAQPTITQSYVTDSQLAPGSLVSLKEDFADHIDPANPDNVDNLLGVVINDGNSLIKLVGTQDSRVQVATSGSVGVLVSDINGPIKRGDHITASPIEGVGMRAASNIRVVGIAQADLTQDRGRMEVYTDENGDEQPILLGEVPVQINISYFFDRPENTIIPATIQNVANAIAGRPIKPLPIIISAIIFIVTLVAVSSIVYSMIRSSIISVGRNPMSQSAVYRNVLQLTALVLGILSVGVASIYLVLTRF